MLCWTHHTNCPREVGAHNCTSTQHYLTLPHGRPRCQLHTCCNAGARVRCCSRVSRAATHARGVLHCVEVGAGVALARKNMCVQSHSRGKLVWSAQHNTLLNLRGQPRCQLHTLQRRHTRAMLQPYVPCGNACSWRAPLLGGWCRGRIDTTKYAILCVQSHARGKLVCRTCAVRPTQHSLEPTWTVTLPATHMLQHRRTRARGRQPSMTVHDVCLHNHSRPARRKIHVQGRTRRYFR